MVAPNALRGLNKLTWHRDGRKAAVGSSDGKVYIYDIGTLSTYNETDYEQFRKNVTNMISQGENTLVR